MTEPNNPNTPSGPGAPGTGGDATTVGNSAPYGNPAGQAPQYGAAPGSSPYGPPGYVAPAYGAPTPGTSDFGAANPYAPPVAGQYGQPPQPPAGGPGYADPGQYGQTAFSQPGQQYPAPGQQFGQSAPAYGQQSGQPGHYGQQPPQYGQQPGQFGQQPGAAGPQYGADPFGGQQPTGSPSKLPKLLGAVGGVILAIAAIVLVTGFWLPGWFPKTLSQSAVEDGVKKVLSNDYSITNVDKVSCPSGESVSEGKTFTCDLSVGGQSQKVTITIVDDDGKYEVSRPS
ncbi:DUF4333 domain-containing protein [Gordonia amarae]|uniref:DUF4333 domain-containing protein n=2 Tax=Gordonia amarae TaxID=36821 RepID=G7GJJ4_9ACTN|nr:DUF4333 domain-containing protein [Gordonia amarae]MCS3879059.1 hypothetical protein [Gordonia amarae]QHN17594.1 DUF4333 domain-containing protein [Gordonia amarae]QHN22120.1 DUF4333 domain-containing protein [Gordonia amarae]QHN31001.1 DUF4333 domain-containing protein [Gordonia amarae]QHN39747.1 DUF4333 domain-containing protein [Gordonia amarae]